MLRLKIFCGCALLVGIGAVHAAPRDEYPRAALPPAVSQLLLDANRTVELADAEPRRVPVGGMLIPQSKATNEAALKILAQIPWPDFAKLRRVRCRYTTTRTGRTNEFVSLWLFYNEGNQLIFLSDHLAKEWRIARETVMEDLDYRAELAALLDTPKATAVPGRTIRNGAEVMPLLNHAVAAAWLGHTNEARQLLQRAVNADYASQTLWRHVGGLARASFEEGLTKLRTGAPRSEVLKQWEETLRVFGSTLAHTQLVDYVTLLRQQVEEFPKLAASAVENPEALPPPARAAYYAGRLQDVKEGNYGEKTVEDTLVALGRDAIPALITHLRDRRLTRLTGSHRNYSTVLRVQDLALVSVEQITKVRFIGGPRVTSGPLYSTRAEAERESIAVSVESWWKTNEQNTSLQWRLARLHELPLSERLSELDELERLDPKATNYLALLQRWAGEVTGRNYEKTQLARALTARGDLSLIPKLREDWRRGMFGDVDLLLQYGNAEDFGALRDAERKRQLERPDPTQSLYIFRLSSMLRGSNAENLARTNALLVPLLVDMLPYRAPNQSFFVDNRSTKGSHADAAMAVLVALTGHNEGYEWTAEFAARDAAISRWAAWWNRTGETEWLESHPETRPAFGSELHTAPQLDVSSLPRLVRILPAAREMPVAYEAPREQVPALLKSGAAEAKQIAGLTQVRFTSASAAEKWFARAKAQPFTNDSYKVRGNNNYERTVRRPGRTPNAFLYPAMQMESAELAALDTRGRTWLVWRSPAGGTLSRFEDDAWKTIFTSPSETFAMDREFRFCFALKDGAMLFTEGFGEKGRLHLFDGKEHLEFPNMEALVQREAKRLRKLLSFPPDPREIGAGRGTAFVLTKDKDGNIWWAGGEKFGVAGTAKSITWTRNDFWTGGAAGTITWMNPLPKGAGVVVAEHRTARVVQFDGKTLQPGAPVDLALASLTGTGEHWPRFLRAEDGRFWVSARESVLFDAGLQRVTSQTGPLLLHDGKDATWFVDYNHSLDTGLIRLGKDGAKATLRLRGLSGPPCDGGDGSVWAHTIEGVVRVAPRAGQLAVIEEAAIPNANHTRLWRDADDRLWIAESHDYYSGRAFKLTAYRTRH
jgi:hypothetical protein